MPVVPFTPTPPPAEPQRPYIPAQDPWLLMAAAQMDADGRLVAKDTEEDTKANG